MAKHHACGTRLYKLWSSMIHRCYLKSDTNYYKYGARGITVCDEWRNDFLAFYDWSMSHGYSDDLTIDRINNNKGYSPDNCRWTTKLIQANNTRRNQMITYSGKTQSLPDWCRELNLNYKTTRMRINAYDWPITRAFITPTKKKCEV